MSFSQYLDSASTWAAANIPIVVGGGVAVAVMTLSVLLFRRRGLDPTRLAAAAEQPNALTEEKAAHWDPPEQSYADRRENVRRSGPPVRVLLSSTVFRNGVNDGYVLDRSTGGLRVAMSAAIAPGSIMQVRAVNAPDTVGFVSVIVRSCRKNGDHFEVGCEFEKTPPWNVLLLFG